jgi:ArsR family transcriptional regulator, arsenate/arsenite/antimonite-responsive transcriptional repressor
MPEEDSDIARILETLKDPTRLQILNFLIKNGPTKVGGIARQFKVTRPAVSHHLRILKDGRTVKSEKRGQEILYSANTRPVAKALRALADRLDKVGASHEKPKPRVRAQ